MTQPTAWQSVAETPPSHEDKVLVIIEQFLAIHFDHWLYTPAWVHYFFGSSKI